jgi:hypothetical protein
MAPRSPSAARGLVAAALACAAVAQPTVTTIGVGTGAVTGVLSQGQYAYYSFALNSSASVVVDLRVDSYGDPDLAVSLTPPPLGGGALTGIFASSSATGSDTVTLSSATATTWPPTFPATFYISVYGATATQFSLQATMAGVSPTSTPSASATPTVGAVPSLSPLPYAATVMTVNGSYTGGVSLSNRRVFYRFHPTAYGVYRFDLSSPNGDVDLYLYTTPPACSSCTGNAIAFANAFGNTDTLEFDMNRNIVPTGVYVEVRYWSGTASVTTFTLQVSLARATDGTPVPSSGTVVVNGAVALIASVVGGLFGLCVLGSVLVCVLSCMGLCCFAKKAMTPTPPPVMVVAGGTAPVMMAGAEYGNTVYAHGPKPGVGPGGFPAPVGGPGGFPAPVGGPGGFPAPVGGPGLAPYHHGKTTAMGGPGATA